MLESKSFQRYRLQIKNKDNSKNYQNLSTMKNRYVQFISSIFYLFFLIC